MPTFSAAVDDLYRVFARYSRPETIDYCEHCQDPNDLRPLLDKDLKHLSAEDLDVYVASVPHTVGSVEDLKHYLPRILELLPADDFMATSSSVALKLVDAEWRSWPADETRAIESYFLAFWIEQRRLSYQAADALRAMAHLFDTLEPLLADWVEDPSLGALEARAQFVLEAVPRVGTNEGVFEWFWPDKAVLRKQIVNWLRSVPVLGNQSCDLDFVERARHVLKDFQGSWAIG